MTSLLLVVPLFTLALHGGTASPPVRYDAERHEIRTSAPARKPAGTDLTLTLPDGKGFVVYESRPGAPADGPAVIVFHEWWGLNDWIRTSADRISESGFRVYAIDLFNGESTTDPARAAMLVKGFDEAGARRKIDALYEHLKDAKSIGTLGWCFGGGWSLKASLAHPDRTRATVIFYGEPNDDVAALRRLARGGGQVLGIFATRDKAITPARVKTFESAAKQAGLALQVRSFDAGHGFANPSQPVYDPEAAAEAMKLADAFLQQRLVPPGSRGK